MKLEIEIEIENLNTTFKCGKSKKQFVIVKTICPKMHIKRLGRFISKILLFRFQAFENMLLATNMKECCQNLKGENHDEPTHAGKEEVVENHK